MFFFPSRINIVQLSHYKFILALLPSDSGLLFLKEQHEETNLDYVCVGRLEGKDNTTQKGAMMKVCVYNIFTFSWNFPELPLLL